jgi:hypothetical protein
VPLVILGDNQDLELAILAPCLRTPVGIEDLHPTRLLTCTWHASSKTDPPTARRVELTHRLLVDPAAAPAFTGTYQGSQYNPAHRPDPRNRQASPEAKPVNDHLNLGKKRQKRHVS